MRTVGDFLTVFAAAQEYNRRVDFDSFPINPVVRRESGQWILESELIPADDCDFECSLEGFCQYWFADGDDIKPDQSDIQYWLSQFDDEGLMTENDERLFQDWFKTGRYVLGPIEHPIEDRNHCIQFKGGAYVELVYAMDECCEDHARFMVMVANYGELFDDLESAARVLFEEFARYETDFR